MASSGASETETSLIELAPLRMDIANQHLPHSLPSRATELRSAVAVRNDVDIGASGKCRPPPQPPSSSTTTCPRPPPKRSSSIHGPDPRLVLLIFFILNPNRPRPGSPPHQNRSLLLRPPSATLAPSPTLRAYPLPLLPLNPLDARNARRLLTRRSNPHPPLRRPRPTSMVSPLDLAPCPPPIRSRAQRRT